MTNAPDPRIVLTAVIDALEQTIEPSVTDEYAASMSRTAAQMLRQLRARLEHELPEIVREIADLHAVLTELGQDAPEPQPARWPDITDARADLTRMEAQLAELVAAETDPDAEARIAAREFVGRQLRGRLPWERDAYNGPRR